MRRHIFSDLRDMYYHNREGLRDKRGDGMKIVYNGPQGEIEMRGVGSVKRLEVFEVSDEIAKDLLRNPMFKEARKDKPKERNE